MSHNRTTIGSVTLVRLDHYFGHGQHGWVVEVTKDGRTTSTDIYTLEDVARVNMVSNAQWAFAPQDERAG